MKTKIKLFEAMPCIAAVLRIAVIAIVAVIGLVVTACDSGGNIKGNQSKVNASGKGGTFNVGGNEIKFAIAGTGSSSLSMGVRAITGQQALTFYVEDEADGNIYELSGVLDTTTKKFSMSSKGDNRVIYQIDGEITGTFPGSYEIAWATVIRKELGSDGAWIIETAAAQPAEEAVTIEGTKGDLVSGFPSSWRGLWEDTQENIRIMGSDYSFAGYVDAGGGNWENVMNYSVIEIRDVPGNSNAYDALIVAPILEDVAAYDDFILAGVRKVLDGKSHTITINAAAKTVQLDSETALQLPSDFTLSNGTETSVFSEIPDTVTKVFGGEHDTAALYYWIGNAGDWDSDEYGEFLQTIHNTYPYSGNGGYLDTTLFLAFMKGEKDPYFDDYSHPIAGTATIPNGYSTGNTGALSVSGIADIPISNTGTSLGDYRDTKDLINQWYDAVKSGWTEQQRANFEARRKIVENLEYRGTGWANNGVNQPYSDGYNTWAGLSPTSRGYVAFAQQSYKDWMMGVADTYINAAKTTGSTTLDGQTIRYIAAAYDTQFWNLDTYDAMYNYAITRNQGLESEFAVWGRASQYPQSSPYYLTLIGTPEKFFAWLKTEYAAKYDFLASCNNIEDAEAEGWKKYLGWASNDQLDAFYTYLWGLTESYGYENAPTVDAVMKIRIVSEGGALKIYNFTTDGTEPFNDNDYISKDDFDAALSGGSDPFEDWTMYNTAEFTFTR